MQIDEIIVKKDKNNNDMKVITAGGKTIYVNSKYDKAIYDAVSESTDIEIELDGKFWKIKPSSLGLPEPVKSTYSKTGQIAQAQQRKENSIEQAQNRTAEMWAKNGAWTIVTHHPAYQNLRPQDIEGTIEDLARSILAMDIRQEPFK